MTVHLDQITVTNNTEQNQFEINVDGQLARAEYRLLGNSHIAFTHTEVPSALEGNGLGSKLARFGLDHARNNNLKVLPYCPYIAKWIERHPEYADLVDRDKMSK